MNERRGETRDNDLSFFLCFRENAARWLGNLSSLFPTGTLLSPGRGLHYVCVVGTYYCNWLADFILFGISD